MLLRFGMQDCKPASTPMECRLKLLKGAEKDRTDAPYRELIGCLTYASITTRPDLAAAVNFLSQFQSCPTNTHWAHLKRILRYVKGTLDFGLVYRAKEGAPTVEVFTDADWANDPTDRRSISGCVYQVLGCTTGWMTRKQNCVSLSSTEAELTALCSAACYEMWLVRLLQDLELKIPEPVTFYEDNQSSIRIAEESKDFGRLKHVDVKYHFLRDLVKEDKICLQFLKSEDQLADMMTKGLPPGAFRKHRASIGLADGSD
uniref:Copia protein n=2 Tax=Culex pipiens TaxID=7175 RepID=A0A8D8BNM2_CULPI